MVNVCGGSRERISREGENNATAESIDNRCVQAMLYYPFIYP